jgi:two-component system, chemotaxis family, CheB/CheR fusion protein
MASAEESAASSAKQSDIVGLLPGPRLVVGIGASAGGLEALEAFMRAMPGDSGMAFIVVQHLSPDHKSHMVELLAKHTAMRVLAAEDGSVIAPNTVYLIPPRKVLTVRERRLRLAERGSGLTLPVDILFRSLAEEYVERAAGVVLSGTGSDGMRGVRALKEAGGLVVVQDPATAKFDGMPRSAASGGLADHVVAVGSMPELILGFANHAEKLLAPAVTLSDDSGTPYEQLLGLLRRQAGVDFAKYKSTTISRRILRRMAILQLDSMEAYVQLAQQSQREVAALFKELLISVTRFFRDSEHFEVLLRDAIPSIVQATRPGEPIRVWVAGCATGEEAYSMAMLFEEYFENGGRPRDVKVFATDIDRAALEVAGAGIYPESIAADVSPERLQRFFVRRGDSYQVARFLRQRVVFANHDLTRDPPFSRVSLISCRNLLIYFSASLQGQVLGAFRFALKEGGYLFLGTSETAGELGDELQVVESRAKLFRRTDVRGRLPEYRRFTAGGTSERRGEGGVEELAARRVGSQVLDAYDVLAQAFVPPTVLVTEAHDVVHFFGRPSELIRLQVGSATLNLLQLVPGPVASVIGLATHRALRDGAEVRYRAVATDLGPATITVRPLVAPLGAARHLLVTLELEQPLAEGAERAAGVPEDAQRQIVDLQQELHYSRENLQATIEELETSNEELQATNEELVASNEELQSTNEELQSVNEELHTLNTEYQQKITELVRLNDDIHNLLLSTRVGSVFLDADLNITRFTPAITQVMNLLERDVGRPLAHLSLEFPPALIFDALSRVSSTGQVIDRELTTAGGRTYTLRVAPYVSAGPVTGGFVVTVVDVTEAREATRKVARVLDALPQHIALLDSAGAIVLVNASWSQFAAENQGRPEATGVGCNYVDVCANAAGSPDAVEVAAHLRRLLVGEQSSFHLEYPCHSATEQRWFLIEGRALSGPEGGVVVSHVNITARKRLEQELEQRLELAVERARELAEREGKSG